MSLILSIFTMVAAMAQAPVVVKATYSVGRGPCQWLPNGARRWALRRGLTVDTIYRGAPGIGFVAVEESAALSVGATYLVALRPSATGADEIVAILKP